jgi:prepilin-type N-terminal cleavage/methylation domain-containing protein
MTTRRHNKRTKQAFSLIEIMVAVTLLAVITIGLLSMFYQTQKAFRLGAGQVDTLEGGRALIELLRRDLQEMYPSHIDHVMNFEAAPSALWRVVMDVPNPGGQKPLLRTNLLHDIAFLTRRGDEWTTVIYRVGHTNQGAGSLLRAVASTNTAFVATASGVQYGPQFEAASVSNLFRTLTTSTSAKYDRIADGIVHFRVFAYDQNGVLYNFPNGAGPEGYQFTNWVPAYVDLEIGILDPKAMTQLASKSNPVVARDFLIGQAHRVQLFTQRIPVRARHAQFDLFTSR